jgi:hypothetical protein
MAWDGWPYSNIQHILYHVTWPWRIIFEKYKESSIYYSKGGLMPWKYFEHEIVPPRSNVRGWTRLSCWGMDGDENYCHL